MIQLPPSLSKRYTQETLSAGEAQRLAEFIAWGPMVFQASRLMVEFGIFAALRDSADGMTRAEVAGKTGLSCYAAGCLLEASLSIGTVLIDPESGRFSLSKAGWFLLNDPATRVNMRFNHDVCYEGMFRLKESLINGRPEGLRHFGSWPTLYEGLSSLPKEVRDSWLAFDHFYSDASFPEALEIVFRKNHTKRLYDVGGNTGKWALQCVGYDDEVTVTILDLPQQIRLMEANIQGKQGAERIRGYGIDLLNAAAPFPTDEQGTDAIWMSQFLDCFSMDEIVSILSRARSAMTPHTRLYIMETLWNRQRYETAALCLTLTSLYFAAMANGNSKMYAIEDIRECIERAGLEIEEIYESLGQGHTIIKAKL